MRTFRGLILPAAMLLIGVALIVQAILNGAVIGIVLGALFMAAGAGRIYLERHR